MSGNPLDKNKTLIRKHLIDKKFGNYLYKPGFATFTTKTGAYLESDPNWRLFGK